MNKKAAISALTALSVALTLGLSGCGSDDDGGPTGPGKIGESDQSTASALVFGVALPLVQNLFLGDYLDQIPAGTPLPRLIECTPLGICDSGSAEFCDSPGSLDVYFYDCMVDGMALAGSLGVTVVDTASGVATLGISVSGFDISGTVTYSRLDNCFGQGYNLQVSTTDANDNELSLTVIGFADYCIPYFTHGETIVPNYAEYTFGIQSLNKTVVVSLYSEGEGVEPGDMEVVVLDFFRTQILLVCHGNIFTGFSSCSTDT